MSELRIGSVVAGHEITRALGSGAMGAVFEVRNLESGARRALKASTSLGDSEDLDRAQREGEAMARLRHPNLLTVHAAGALGGRSYLIMELAEGGSLGERLRSGLLDVTEARSLLFSLARALAAAHAAGVIHRDIKPDNVLFSKGGEPKLADFGLASLTDRSRLTETGSVLGTPVYMAPEQARGEQVGPPADVYALGATLYSALGGRPPVESAGSLLATLARIQDEVPPPLRSLNRGCPTALSNLVAAMLRKEPAERPTLSGLLGQEQSARAAGSGLPWAQAGGVGLALTLAVAWVVHEGPPTPPPVMKATSSPSRTPTVEAPGPSPLATAHVTSKAALARQALETYVQSRHCSTSLRAASARASGDRRAERELVKCARDYARTPDERLRAQVTLGTRGYLAWLESALLPEVNFTDDLRELYLALASLACRAATEELGQRARGNDVEAAGAWSDLTSLLSIDLRFSPDPSWPMRLWLRAWPYRVSQRSKSWSQARDALRSEREDTLATYLLAFSEARPGRDRERLAVELHRVAEATWLRSWGATPQRLIPAIDSVLEITEWGAGRLYRALAAWPSSESSRSTPIEVWRALEADLNRAIELDPDLRLAYVRLSTVHLRLGQPREALATARRVLLIYPDREVVDYALPVRVALEGAQQDVALVTEARLAVAEFEEVARRVPKAAKMMARYREQLRRVEESVGREAGRPEPAKKPDR